MCIVVVLNTAACLEHGVTRLVYTSTYNVVFGGQEIRNGDETLDYLPLDKVQYILLWRDKQTMTSLMELDTDLCVRSGSV